MTGRGAEGGFVPVNDQGDAYKLVYPFGWQEVSVTGQVPHASVTVSQFRCKRRDTL